MKRFLLFAIIGLSVSLSISSYAQTCTNKTRVYANSQFSIKNLNILSTGEVRTENDAIDASPFTNSTLYLSAILSGNITQFLEFKESNSRKIITGANTIYVKLSLPATFLNAGGSIEIGTFRYTSGNLYAQTLKYNGTTVVGLIGGPGTVEIPLQLSAGELANGVYVKLVGGILSIPISTDIYGAYVLEDTLQIPDCDKGIDVLSGLSDNAILPVGSAFGSISGEPNAIDASPYSTYANLSAGLNVANSAYLTAVFSRPSVAGDSAKVIIENLGGGLNLLSGLSIQSYLGSAATGGASAIVSKPVPGYPNLTEISFAVNTSFDRVRVSYGGILGLSGSLRVYDIKKVIPKPIPLIDGLVLVAKDICSGVSPELSINNIQNCTTYKWYANETTSTPLFTGQVFKPGALSVGEHVYYVESRRDNCLSSISERVKITITVNPLPEVAVTNLSNCSGSSVTLSVNNPVNGITYNWYDAATDGSLIGTGKNITVTSSNANKTYFAEAINPVTGCVSINRAPLLVTINPLANIGATSGDNQLCVGDKSTLSNSAYGGKWYSSDALVATVNISTGEVTAVSSGNVTIKYVVDTTPTTCSNSADYNVAVFAIPDLTLGTMPEICAGVLIASLPYSNPINSPTTYSISSASANLIAISDQTLSANSIPVQVSSTITPGTYSGTLTIKNINGCSNQFNFNIKINPKPSAPHVLVQSNSQY